MTSIYDQQPRIKMYTSTTNAQFSGEALVTFLREESVQLACTLYDSTPFRVQNPSAKEQLITVQAAHFSQPERENTSKPDKRILKASFDRMKQKLAWNEQDLELCTVIVKGEWASADQAELIKDFAEQCAEDYGPVREVKIVDGQRLSVHFHWAKHAERCAAGLNGRWYDGQQLAASVQ